MLRRELERSLVRSVLARGFRSRPHRGEREAMPAPSKTARSGPVGPEREARSGGAYSGCGTMRRYGRGAFQPSGNFSFAASSGTAGTMMTSSPITGFDLIVSNQAGKPQDEAAGAEGIGERMEINAAYGLIRARLKGSALTKTSLRQGQIALSFISPQVGERHIEVIRELAQETGYSLYIHPHPNQHLILQRANRLLREKGWQIVKGPGIRVDRAELTVKLAGKIAAADIEALNEELAQETGFKLAVET